MEADASGGRMVGCRNCGGLSTDGSVNCQHCGLRIAPYTEEETRVYLERLQAEAADSADSRTQSSAISLEDAGGIAICANCRYRGAPVTVTKGSFWMEASLWTFIVPGIIYSIWRAKSRERVCPKCQHPHMVPVNSRAGQLLAKQCEDSALL